MILVSEESYQLEWLTRINRMERFEVVQSSSFAPNGLNNGYKLVYWNFS